jgi:hypothetical protein
MKSLLLGNPARHDLIKGKNEYPNSALIKQERPLQVLRILVHYELANTLKMILPTTRMSYTASVNISLIRPISLQGASIGAYPGGGVTISYPVAGKIASNSSSLR